MRNGKAGPRPRVLAAAAVTAALLVPLAVFGAPALATPQHAASAQYQYKVTVCHLTGSKKHPAVTISVAASAVAAVLKGGGHLGPCTGTEKPKAHGSSSNNNKSNTNNGNHPNNGHHNGKP
jgi:hypothetical protein